MFREHYDFHRTPSYINEIGWGPSGKRTRSSYKFNIILSESDNKIIEKTRTKYLKKREEVQKEYTYKMIQYKK